MKLKKVLIGLFTLLLAVVLVACGNTHTIKFESNEGSAVAAISAKAGAAITKPADPTKQNMTFGGWYSDIDLVEAYEFPATMPDEDVTLYAKWVVTVTFDSNGGPAIAPIVCDGKTFKLPDDPVRDGYVFIGWFTDRAYTNPLTFVTPKTNITAYAQWQVYEVGSKIDVPLTNLDDNDGAFVIAYEEDGAKITATSGKGEWSFVAASIPVGSKQNKTVVVELEGTAGIEVTLKVEGGNAASPTEGKVIMTGQPQTFVWTGLEENFSSVSGARFLVFLNGGNEGCGDTPEYVKIKSVKLCRTVDADATQKAAIFFNTNGGSEVAELYDVPGATVAAPEDPVKSGFDFAGWFADKALTTPYTFTSMPEQGAIVYAKWEKSAIVVKSDEDILTAEIIPGTNSVIDVHREVIIAKNGGSEWEWVGLKTDAALEGYNKVVATVKGTAGEILKFKTNDKGAGEYDATMTGEFDEVVITLADGFVWDDAKQTMILMPNGGMAAGTGHDFIITKLELQGEGKDPIDLLRCPIVKAEACKAVRQIVMSKPIDDTADWDCVKLDLGLDFAGYAGIKFTIKGTDGEQLLLKANDQNACEHKVTIADGVATGFIDLSNLTYTLNNVTFVVFPNVQAAGTAHEFYITELVYVFNNGEGDEESHDDVDVIANAAVTKNAHEYHYELNAVKNGSGEWEWVGIKTSAELEGYTKVVYAIQGPDGEMFKFKTNDKGAGEFDVHTNGTLQEGEFALPASFAWNPEAQTMIMFPNAGVVGTGHEFVITKLELQGEGKDPINLLAATASCTKDCAFQKVLVITKPSSLTGANWDCVKLDLEADLSGYKAVKYSVKGTADEQIMFKTNDQFEQRVTFNGEVQEGILDLSGKTIDPTKSAMVLFANPGQGSGSGNPIYIYELVFLYELPEE